MDSGPIYRGAHASWYAGLPRTRLRVLSHQILVVIGRLRVRVLLPLVNLLLIAHLLQLVTQMQHLMAVDSSVGPWASLLVLVWP